MSWETLSVDTSKLEAGKFYKVYSDELGNTLLIPKEEEDKLANRVEALESNTVLPEDKKAILDNRYRINNLENTERQRTLYFLDQLSTRVSFENQKKVSIDTNREVLSLKIIAFEDMGGEIHKKNITGTSTIFEEELEEGKRVILDFGDTPKTGYAIIL